MSTPTTAPPAWLEAAAKLDALLGDKVPLSTTRTTQPPIKDVADDEGEIEAQEPEEEAVVEALAVASREEARPLETVSVARPEPRPPEKQPLADEPPFDTAPRPRITIAPVGLALAGPAASAEEVDLAWHGYSAVALLPSTLALSALTAVAVVSLRSLVPAWVMHEAVDAPLAALWLLQAIRAVYRVFAYHYRLTTRRLFRERGRLYPAEPPLELALVVRAEVRQDWFGRTIGVGMVRVIPEDATPGQPAVELAGVYRPTVLAKRIEGAAKAARDKNVIAFATDEHR